MIYVKCPLKFKNTNRANSCEGISCAWWLDHTKECAVKLIATNLIAFGQDVETDVQTNRLKKRM